MTRLPISHRSPIRTPAWSNVWSPILTSAPTLTLLTSLQLFPITQFGPTQQNGPIQTLAPMRAVGSITAQGCIPGATFTGRSKSCVNLAKTNLGRLTTIRLGVGTPSIPAGTTALTILPDSRTEASLGDRTKARSESPCAIAGWTIRVTETEASPRTSPPIKSAISPKVFIRETNCVFPGGDQRASQKDRSSGVTGVQESNAYGRERIVASYHRYPTRILHRTEAENHHPRPGNRRPILQLLNSCLRSQNCRIKDRFHLVI